MENNFNLRKFLTENKLTGNSKQLSEGAADNLELKNVAKQLYLGFKKMGVDVELSTNNGRINQAKKGDLDEKNVWIYQGDKAIEITLVGDKAMSFEDKIKNDPAFTKFKFPKIGWENGATWGGQKTRSIQITPGATTSENKLTDNSKLLKESPNDIVWTDEEEDTGSHGTFNQLDLDASDLDYYEVEVLGYSTSTGKAYSGKTSGEYGEVNYDDIDEIEEMNPEETENYILHLKKYEPEHFRKMSQLNTKELSEEENGGTFFKATVNLADKPGVDYGYTLHAQDEESAKAELASKLQGQEYQLKDLKGPFTPQPEQGEISSKVDKSSIEIDGVDSSDYPDFVDAFISAANFEDGTPLTDDELDQLGDEMSDEIHQMAYDSLMEGLSEREKTLKEEVLKALK